MGVQQQNMGLHIDNIQGLAVRELPQSWVRLRKASRDWSVWENAKKASCCRLMRRKRLARREFWMMRRMQLQFQRRLWLQGLQLQIWFLSQVHRDKEFSHQWITIYKQRTSFLIALRMTQCRMLAMVPLYFKVVMGQTVGWRLDPSIDCFDVIQVVRKVFVELSKRLASLKLGSWWMTQSSMMFVWVCSRAAWVWSLVQRSSSSHSGPDQLEGVARFGATK